MLSPPGSDPDMTAKLTLDENGVMQKLAAVTLRILLAHVPFAKETLVMLKDPDEVPLLMVMLRFVEAWLLAGCR